MSNWNGKLECIKNYGTSEQLTKGNVYDVKNGRFLYDDGCPSFQYKNYNDLIRCNLGFNYILVEYKEPIQTWSIKETKTVRYITISDEVTIAIPSSTPMGITVRHPDDEYHEETGQAIAFKRLHDKVYG